MTWMHRPQSAYGYRALRVLEPQSELTVNGPVIGYRHWVTRVNDGRYELQPWGRTDAPPWHPGVNVAQCMISRQVMPVHKAPAKGCHCGFNAWHSLETSTLPVGMSIVGAISAWGEMEVHAKGFRAEYARVVALATYDLRADHRALADRYRVPLLRSIGDLQAVALEHGDLLPDDAYPALPDVPDLEKYFNRLVDVVDTVKRQTQRQPDVIRVTWACPAGTVQVDVSYAEVDPLPFTSFGSPYVQFGPAHRTVEVLINPVDWENLQRWAIVHRGSTTAPYPFNAPHGDILLGVPVIRDH